MDSFGFSHSVKKREDEQAKRRELLRKQMQEKATVTQDARNRTDILIEQANALRRSKEIQLEMERLRDEGARDNGVKFECSLEAVTPKALRGDSDRVILPQGVLTALSTNASVQYPMLFEVYSPETQRRTHCGVLEFSGSEGQVVLPAKVLHCLGLAPDAGSPRTVRIRYKVLPKCESLTLKVPLSMFSVFPDFKPFLESSLRTQYATMTVGDQLVVGGNVPIVVERIEPESAVCIVDADVELDLVVVDDQPGEKWLPGSAVQITSQAKLWTGKLRDTDSLRISTNASVDLFASFPPLTDANFNSFDLFEPFEDVSRGEVSLRADFTQILARGLSSWPEVIMIGIHPVRSDASGPVTVRAEVVTDTPYPLVVSDSQSTTTTCPNCLSASIPASSLSLHLVHCEARFRLCSICRKPVRVADLPRHAHCDLCARSYDDLDIHVQEWHSPMDCLCGTPVTRASLRDHRIRDCSARLVACRFCGLHVPVGNVGGMDARDRLMGFQSEHEAACGNRTEPCAVCHKRERLKDMAFHMQAYHP